VPDALILRVAGGQSGGARQRRLRRTYRANADNYFGLANELERLLERRVDMVTERSVRNPYFRQDIEATHQPVYEG